MKQSVSMTVTLTGEPAGASVNYRTVNGTAVASADYTAAVGVLEFEPGESVSLDHPSPNATTRWCEAEAARTGINRCEKRSHARGK